MSGCELFLAYLFLLIAEDSVDREGNLGLVFLVFHGPAFPRRSPLRFGLHPRLRSWRKPRNSLRLASCMPRAASVSLCAFAMWSKLSILSSGLR